MIITDRRSKPWWMRDGIKARIGKTVNSIYADPVRLWGWKLAHLPLKPV